MGQCQQCQNVDDQLIDDIDHQTYKVFKSIQEFTSLPYPDSNEEIIEDFSYEAHVPSDNIVPFQEPITLQKLQIEQSLRDVMLPKSENAYKINNFIYIGQWKYYKPHGLGIFYYADGTIYDGLSQNCAPHHYGRKYYRDGSIYEGEFKDGLQHGWGKFTSDGFTFNGYWKLNYPSEGLETWPNGNMYEGTYLGGQKHGHGKFIWGGSEYVGDFANDKFNGYGVYKFDDGHIYEGQWKQGKMHGQGCLTYPNGDWYKGGFIDDKRHGMGKMKLQDGQFEGKFVNGQLEGECKLQRGGVVMISHWSNGNKV